MVNQFIDKKIYTDKNFPKKFVCHSYSQSLYQFTPYVHSINLGGITGKTLLNIINTKSKNSTYGAK